MRLLLIGLVFWFATVPASAGEKVKPNTLTPEEIADGWLLLFDGETTFGWKAGTTEADIKPSLTVKNGALILAGFNTYADFTTRFQFFELDFDYHTEGSEDANFNIHTPTDGKKSGLLMGFGIQGAQGAKWAHAHFRIIPDGLTYRLERPNKAPYEHKANRLSKWYGVSYLQFSPDPKKDNSKLFLRNIKLKPLNTTSLFNGTDLSGWKKFTSDKKPTKSEFTVTKEGWLNIKNGPGDLQTVGKWADFVLQVDCISNGKYLNSGVFFRCRPDEYQQGYEAQIHNKFSKEPTKEYTIEEYDPKTNKLLGKKKVKYAAADYGTGAIYRRMPARREVAKDNEWFTMTVVAQGRHIATWVNGIQVVDWIDNRPLADNARNGCRLEAGPISLQGHDPTTNLSFRNFRIAELPAPPAKK
jgi:hypothetical protein